MKEEIKNLVYESIKAAKLIKLNDLADIQIEISRTKNPDHGQFSCNIALHLSKELGLNAVDLAHQIADKINDQKSLEKIVVDPPGFINFYLSEGVKAEVIKQVLKLGTEYGSKTIQEPKNIILEFVSSNPTGPLHIGHGRGAAYGAAIVNLLKKTGFNIHCEYYVNDSGRQMDILTVSTWIRYLQQYDKEICFPESAYKGNYIIDIAADLKNKYANKFVTPHKDILDLLDTKEEADIKIDKLIKHCTSVLGGKNYRLILETCLDSILSSIKNDLNEFGVEFNNWYSEYSLLKNNSVNQCIAKLNDKSWIYQKDGAKWFRSSKLGDEKDRVLEKENGQKTYFASDIAYHLSKFERGYKKIINIWGADHHGYIERVKASMKALDYPPEAITILLVQFATLFRGKEKLQMSTRSGEFITLKELIKEVGKDAARFFYIMRKNEQHLDFDLELAKSESNDNPVYYIQYAHARICSVFRQMNEKGYTFFQSKKLSDLSTLTEDHEIKLLRSLAKYPDVIENAAVSFEPHQLAYYLKDLANDFHTYYNVNQFLVEDDLIRNARLSLIDATRQVIRNGLLQLGVSSPEEM